MESPARFHRSGVNEADDTWGFLVAHPPGQCVLSFDDMNPQREKPNCLIVLRLAQQYYGLAMTAGILKPGFLPLALALKGVPGAVGLDAPMTPSASMAGYSQDPQADLPRPLRDGARQHTAVLRYRDTVAAELKLTQDTRVPVLRRLPNGVEQRTIPGARLARSDL